MAVVIFAMCSVGVMEPPLFYCHDDRWRVPAHINMSAGTLTAAYPRSSGIEAQMAMLHVSTSIPIRL
jgi:hypothetical protein